MSYDLVELNDTDLDVVAAGFYGYGYSSYTSIKVSNYQSNKAYDNVNVAVSLGKYGDASAGITQQNYNSTKIYA